MERKWTAAAVSSDPPENNLESNSLSQECDNMGIKAEQRNEELEPSSHKYNETHKHLVFTVSGFFSSFI